MEFNFFMPVKLLSGMDAVIKNGDIFSEAGKKCLIVTGGSSAKKSGALSDAESTLEKCGIQYSIFNEITANPSAEVCHKGGAAANSFGADFVLGIGGGSALDAAKAIAFFAANPSFESEDIYSYTECNSPFPLFLIGTSAGTGSEVKIHLLPAAFRQHKHCSRRALARGRGLFLLEFRSYVGAFRRKSPASALERSFVYVQNLICAGQGNARRALLRLDFCRA